MVFLTLSCWIRSRGPDRYWKVQEVLKHARHFRGRRNRCYGLAVKAVRRAFVYATKARRMKKRNMRTLWITRIAAASREHGMKYPALMHNLTKSSVQLNRRVISDMAVTEPGHSSHLLSWHRLGNRKASRQRWVMAKSLLVFSLVLFACNKGLAAVMDLQMICALKSSALGLLR
ncbi:hypothetical protein INR49_029575 [Caranx melampygus]|nr:hypothetical protein INR49_029575 [Caranx melampygus]